MAFMRKLRGNQTPADTQLNGTTSPNTVGNSYDGEKLPGSQPYAGVDDGPVHIFSLRVITMGVIVSMGGFIFGYDTGQISGFLEMNDFLVKFGDVPPAPDAPAGTPPSFSNGRSGTIVGLLSIGTLMGAILAAPIADRIGRKYCIVAMCIIFCVGVIVQIATETHWYQIAIGRWVAGLGVGGLSVLTPMYQSETAPRQIRGALVSCYQLFITLGIFVAYCINFGTYQDPSTRSWRLPMAIGFIWPVIMAFGILFMRESPRWEYGKGRIESARKTMALSYGVSENHREVRREMAEIKQKHDESSAMTTSEKLKDIFIGPRMLYRVLLGMTLQALQQLTGANFFFYYGTSVFSQIGITNGYVASMILGGINFGSTFLGLYVVEHFGRRPSLMFGGVWMFMCFMIFASVGHFTMDPATGAIPSTDGTVMIVFTALFIFVYAITWGPIIWAIVGELYPSRNRALCMGLATSSNWAFNFLISFFTPYITGDIDYRYGYVFAACNLAGSLIVYFFLCESQGRSLEEIDTMYIEKVTPWRSKTWVSSMNLEEEDAAARLRQGKKNEPGYMNGLDEVEKKENRDSYARSE